MKIAPAPGGAPPGVIRLGEATNRSPLEANSRTRGVRTSANLRTQNPGGTKTPGKSAPNSQNVDPSGCFTARLRPEATVGDASSTSRPIVRMQVRNCIGG